MTQLLAPPARRSRRERMTAPVLTLGGLGLATTALHLRDPHERGSWGFCPSAALGFSCPGCGGLRAVNDLTNLDVAAAASSNLFFVVLLPFLVLGLAVWTRDRWTGHERTVSWPVVTAVAYGTLALLLVFTVVRNLPFGAWLAP